MESAPVNPLTRRGTAPGNPLSSSVAPHRPSLPSLRPDQLTSKIHGTSITTAPEPQLRMPALRRTSPPPAASRGSVDSAVTQPPLSGPGGHRTPPLPRRRPTKPTATPTAAAAREAAGQGTAYLAAQLPFLAATGGHIERTARDWNAEFQSLWVECVCGGVSARDPTAMLAAFLDEFERHAKAVAEAHMSTAGEAGAVRATGSGRAVAPVRQGNLFVYVWPEAKLGMWTQRSYRAVLECRVPFLFAPLMATFRFFHEVVTVAAAIPVDRAKPPEYSGSGRPDAFAVTPLEEHLRLICAALNVGGGDSAADPPEHSAVPADTAGALSRKMRGVEAREGLDMRIYLTNCIGLLPPIRAATGNPVTLRRWGHLVQHPPAPTGDAAIALYRRDAVAALQYLPSVLEAPLEKRNARLVELLHANGLNVCFLGLLALAIQSTTREDLEDISELLLQVISTEMLARAVRRAMFDAMAQEHCAPTVKSVNAYLERAAGSLISGSQDRFEEGLRPVLADAFWFDEAADTTQLMARLKATLRRDPVHITKRLCQLCGLQVMRGTVTEVLCTPSHHNYGSLFSVQHEAVLNAIGKETATYPPGFTSAFLVPLRIRYFSRNGRMAEAWRETLRLVELRGRNLGERFVNAETWTAAALVAANCGREAESALLIARAADVFNRIPAYVAHSSAGEVRLPSYLYYFPGQGYVRLAHGAVMTRAGRLDRAEESFQEALRLPDVFPQERQYFLGLVRQQAMLGLFSIAARSDVAKATQFDQQWSRELRSMAPTLLGARISELFGSLFFERALFANAVGRLWECLETTEQLLGPTALRVAEVLNKLAYVYYCWDARQYGLFCSCILHRAEMVVREEAGPFSPLHLSIAENIIALFIQRGMYVEASQRLHELRTLPARYTARVSRDHPAMTRIAVIEAKLQRDFAPFAITIIQRCWREYHSRALVRAECERNVREMQRVGRGFLVRRMMVQLYVGTATPETIVQRAQAYAVLSFSRPLIAASAFFDKDARHWNSEAQQRRLFVVPWDRLEQLTIHSALQRVEGEFVETARRLLVEMRSGTQRGVPVPGCSTSVVLHNMVFTQVPSRHRLSRLQVCVARRLRRHRHHTLTAPLSALVEFPECDYYVEALIPFHHRPQMALKVDGSRGVRYAPRVEDMVRYIVRTYAQSGLTTWRAEGWQGLELVVGADELLYVTNGLGLVSRVLQEPDDTLEDDDARLPRDHFWTAWALWEEGRAKDAVALLEHTLLDSQSAEHGAVQLLLLSYFAYARVTLGDDVDAALRLFQRCSATIEDSGAFVSAALLSYAEGRAWMHRELPRLAIEPLTRALHVLRKEVRLHAYFGSFYLLEIARAILRATVTREAAIDAEVLSCVAHAVELGEPTLHLFTTCGRFIGYAHAQGETQLWQLLVRLRDRRAKELMPAERDRMVRVLLEQSEELQRRGGTESYRDCAFLLQTAICLAELASQESKVLGVLLTSYGLLLTTMGKLKEARRLLRRANAVLSRTVSSASPEMTMWHKNSRILNHRIRENAFRVIRRAVWRWKERRRLDRKMEATDPAGFRTLQAVRLQRRLNRIVVVEATARVFIAEGQSEEWYRLLRRQGRMRNDAMLKQTYGSRVQIFNSKIQSALHDLAELAFATKRVLAETAWAIRGSVLTTFVLGGHRLERRSTIAQWHHDRIRLKLWHIEGVDRAIRAEFLSSFQAFIARCVSAEERAWRRIILRNQKKTKRQIARAIVRALHRKPKSAAADLRVVLLEEVRRRDQITWREAEDFRQLLYAFNFGPVVEDVDVDVEEDESVDSWQD